MRQRLAQFACEARCLRLSRYRSLTAALKGKVPGAESSFGKLFATELNLRVAMFADEMLGALGIVEEGSKARSKAAAGCIARWQRAADDCGGIERDPAQHHRRAGAETAPRLSRGGRN